MGARRHWPFPIPTEAQGSDATRRQVAFFDGARQLGFQAFDQGSLVGATAPDGREGSMIPRRGTDGGLRRVWEVTLGQPGHTPTSFHVEGFEHAAELILRWLRGVGSDAADVPAPPATALPRLDVTNTDREPNEYRSGLVTVEELSERVHTP